MEKQMTKKDWERLLELEEVAYFNFSNRKFVVEENLNPKELEEWKALCAKVEFHQRHGKE